MRSFHGNTVNHLEYLISIPINYPRTLDDHYYPYHVLDSNMDCYFYPLFSYNKKYNASIMTEMDQSCDIIMTEVWSSLGTVQFTIKACLLTAR